MLQTMKRPLSLLCAFIMCFAMLGGIVLPQLVETETALAADADPYAAVNEHTTELTVTEGTITFTDGETEVTLNVPSDLADKTIRLPDEKVRFYDPDWIESNLEIQEVNGTKYFFAVHGDGTTWGTGDVYVAKWGVNSYGEVLLRDVTDVNGNVTVTAPNADYKGWSDLVQDLRMIKPVVDADNNQYVLTFPGKMPWSTGTTGSGVELVHKTADVPAEHATKTAMSEFEQSDFTNVYFVGPQAGVSPTAGKVGDTTLSNGRGVDKSKETIFGSTFWTPTNAVWHFDGIALEGSARSHGGTYTTATYSGVYFNNVYFRSTDSTSVTMLFGSNNKTSTIAAVYHVTNCYFESTQGKNTSSVSYVQANDIKFDNVVITNLTNINTGNSIRFLPGQGDVVNSAFLGEYRNKFNAEITNSTFDYDTGTMLGTYAARHGHLESSKYSLKNNYFRGWRNTFLDLEAAGETASASNLFKISYDITGNHIESSKDTTNIWAIQMREGLFASGDSFNYKDNVFVSTPMDVYYHEGNPASGEQIVDFSYVPDDFDPSGNLFMTHDGQVRVVRLRPANAKSWDAAAGTVYGDLYASGLMGEGGGIRDLFTVTETTQDLLVLNTNVVMCMHSKDNPANDTGIMGSITVLPEAGKTYDTENLFLYKDKGVEYLGVYSDLACTTPVSSFTKGFDAAGDLYVKARYSAGGTVATIVYDLHEPTHYHIADNSSLGTYTFNGDTFTTESTNATFYASFAAADDAAATANGTNYKRIDRAAFDARPSYLKNVILLMPGNYNDWRHIKYACAVIGPKFGVDPTVEGSAAVSSERSTSTATEAVVPARWVISMNLTPFATFAGITFTGTASGGECGLITRVHPNWGGYPKDNEYNFNLNLADCYFSTKGNPLVVSQQQDDKTDGSTSYAQSRKDDAKVNNPVYINDCYFTGGKEKAAHGIFIQSPYVKIKDSTIKYISAWDHYYLPTNPTLRSVPQITGGYFMEGCYVDGTDATYRFFNGAYTWIAGGETLKDGQMASFVGNTFNNMKGDYIIQMSSAANNSTSVIFNNNVVKSDTEASHWVISTWTNNEKRAILEVNNNVLYNYTKPWNLINSNNENVDDNYYGAAPTSDRIYVLNTAQGSGYTKSSNYYTDPAMTNRVDVADFELMKGSFENATTTGNVGDTSFGGGFRATLTALKGKTYTLSDFRSVGGAVTGIQKVSGSGTIAEGVYTPADGDKIGVTVTVKGYSITWFVTVSVVAGPWEANGLAPATEGGVVDITAQANYTTRTGGIIFMAPDFSQIAYADPELTTLWKDVEGNNLVDPTEGSAKVGDFAELPAGTVFYAKMPTTNTIYKLTYGVTASNAVNFDPWKTATLVMFPGTYSKFAGTGWNGYTAEPTWGGSTIGIGYTNAKDTLILGPQAGVAAGNVADGTATRTLDPATEAIFTLGFDLRNQVMSNGGKLVVDGIAGTGNIHFKPQNDAVNGSTGTATFTFNNLLVKDYDVSSGNNGLFAFNGGYINSSNSTAKMTMILNINGGYFESLKTDAEFATMGRTQADEIHLDNCVVINEKTADNATFYVVPTKPANNSTKHKLSYTCDNSYVKTTGTFLFGLYLEGVPGITTSNRSGIEIRYDNNKLVDCGTSAANSSRNTALTVYYAGLSDAEEPVVAGMTNFKFTNNTITASNTTARLFTTLPYEHAKADISGNVVSGYGIAKNAIEGLSASVDVANNVFTSLDGKDFIAPKLSGVTMSDVAFSKNGDFVKDFAITGYNGAATVTMGGEITWVNDGTNVYDDIAAALKATLDVGEASVTAHELLANLQFASANVTATKIEKYNADGSRTEVVGEAITAGNRYRLTIALAGWTIFYDLYTAGKVEGATEYSATTLKGKYYFDNALVNHPDGAAVVYPVNIDGEIVNVQFTVGENVFGDAMQVPEVDGERHIYLFAKTYTGGANASGSSTDRGNLYYFYGAKAGISGVTTDASGMPNGKNPERDNLEEETIWKNYSLTIGYQAQATMDGITLEGECKIEETAGNVPPYLAGIHVLNCVGENLLQTKENGQVFNVKNDSAKVFTMENCYFTMDPVKSTKGNLVVGRHVEQATINNNYLMGSTGTNLFYFATVSYGTDDAHASKMDLDITNNALMGGTISFEKLTNTKKIPVDVNISGNKFVNTYGGYLFSFADGTSVEETAGLGEGSKIVVDNNTITSPEDVLAYTHFYFDDNKGATTAHPEYIISNNTVDGGAKHVFEIKSDAVVDASDGNKFVGFDYNFGLYSMLGKAVIGESRVAGIESKLLLAKGGNASTVVIDGVEYAADADNSAEFSILDITSSGAGVYDNTEKTIEDIAADTDNYVFHTDKGMMVKATIGEDVYYNAIPLTDGKAIATVELIKLDGTAAGTAGAYELTAYANPFDLEMTTPAVEEMATPADAAKPFATVWTGKINAGHGHDITALLTNFKVLDYGMYYGTTADAVSDEGIANYVEYTEGAETTTAILKNDADKVIGQKESYASDANGLANVYLEYSLRMNNVGASKTRYGRMYLTYEINGKVHTIYSDAASVVTSAIANVQ